MIDAAPSREFFNRSNITTGILLEGKFSSVFKNRIVDKTALPSGFTFLPESKPTAIAVFSDGGLLSNKVSYATSEPKISPLGYDRVSKLTYGNRDFFFNLMLYLSDDAIAVWFKGQSLEVETPG